MESMDFIGTVKVWMDSGGSIELFVLPPSSDTVGTPDVPSMEAPIPLLCRVGRVKHFSIIITIQIHIGLYSSSAEVRPGRKLSGWHAFLVQAI